MSNVFRIITTTRSISILRNCYKNLSYTRSREKILEGLLHIGVKYKQFGVHSPHSEGATAAANLGAKDKLFKKHEKWRSETIKDKYIHKNIQNKLIVTKRLGL